MKCMDALASQFCLFLAIWGNGVAPSVPLSTSERMRIDRAALRLSAEQLPEEGLRFAGDLTAWILHGSTLTPDEERVAAERWHRDVTARYGALPVPTAANRIFTQLIEQLPSHYLPVSFHYSLTVVDLLEPQAWTGGGGFVYVSRASMEHLLAGGKSGEAALAFVLARAIGNAALLHTRVGWQRKALAQQPDGVEVRAILTSLATMLAQRNSPNPFCYSRGQIYEADRFALELCQNAGFDVEDALDALRLEADRMPEVRFRLRQLRMDLDGRVEDEIAYGLFDFDPIMGTFERCRPHSIVAGQSAVVFVHGLSGGTRTFRKCLHRLADEPSARRRRLLVFRYPNTAGLARCGRFLRNEMARTIASPERVVFICHSAGGLVFRWYAEKAGGRFDRAVLIGTPHGGSRLARMKALAETAHFFPALPRGPFAALDDIVVEGSSQMLQDLHPNSFFLGRLGRNAEMSIRYRVVVGECLDRKEGLAVGLAFGVAKRALLREAIARLQPLVLRERAMRRLAELTLPSEVMSGDLAVSVSSALLPSAGGVTRLRCPHFALPNDPQVWALVREAVCEE